MKTDIRYVHTNLVAKDWRKLSEFYINVFDCQPIYPQRDLSGTWIDKITKIEDVKIKGIHLNLPGYEDGPTLEIFEYEPSNLRDSEPLINYQGYGHIAFHVDNVSYILKKLIEYGGTKLGEIITKEYTDIGTLTVVYARDPENNFIEIQNWSKLFF